MIRILLCLFSILFFLQPLNAADSRVEAIGVLGGQNLYFTYTAVGVLADAYKAGVYSSEFTKKLSKEMMASCRKARATIMTLIDDKTLTGADKIFGRLMIDAYDALIDEVNALVSVIETDNSEARKDFESFKSRSWSKIQAVLNPD